MSNIAAEITIRQDLRFILIRPDAAKVAVRPMDESADEIQGTINDMSRNGMRLQVDRRIETGTELEIDLTVESLEVRSIHSGIVRWMQPRGPNTWWIGCELKSPVASEVLNELATGGVLDRRQDDRRPASFQATANWQLNSEPASVTIKNYSIGGCCIEIFGEATELGDRLLLVIENDDITEEKQMSTRIPLRVMWSKRSHDGDGLLVGCSFLTRDGYQKLRNLIEYDGVSTEKTSIFVAVTRWRWIAITALVLLSVQMIDMVKRQFFVSEPFMRGIRKINSKLAPGTTELPPAKQETIADETNITDEDLDFRPISDSFFDEPDT